MYWLSNIWIITKTLLYKEHIVITWKLLNKYYSLLVKMSKLTVCFAFKLEKYHVAKAKTYNDTDK